MKHTVYALLSAAAILTSSASFAQKAHIGEPSKALKNIKMKRPVHNHLRTSELPLFPVQAINPTVASNPGRSFGPEVVIGQTLYDLQTNNSVNYRIENFGDGTLSAIWTFSNQSTAWTDRGMAYHHFDGSAWTKNPAYQDAGNITRIEDVRTGFGSLARVTGVGDIVVAHQALTTASAPNAIQVTRNVSMTDENWLTYGNTSMPLIWPRMRTGGPDGKTVHVIAVTEPSGGTFTGTPYYGINGCMLYNRSTDGGATFDKLMVRLPGVDSTIFASFGGDSYAMDVKGNTVAIVAGDITSRVQMWKSTDNGETWTSRTVLPFPYEPWVDATITDLDGNGTVDSILVDTANNVYELERIETSDGSFAIVIDNNDKVHVYYGRGYMSNDDSTDGNVSYYPGANGIMYWNEDFAVDSLPQVIGGTIDRDGDDLIDVSIYFNNTTTVPYGSGMSSFPSAGVDADGTLYLSYAAYIEGIDYYYLGTGPSFKHLYLQKSTDGGATWTDPKDIVGDEQAGFDQLAEYQYASIARTVDNNLHIVYQKDYTPGSAVTIDNAATHPFDIPNDIVYMSVTKDFDQVGIAKVNSNVNGLAVMPNPASDMATLKFDLNSSENVSVNVVNMLGQRVMNLNSQHVAAGQHSISLSTNQLPAGIYLVNVTAGSTSSSVKMIVKH